MEQKYKAQIHWNTAYKQRLKPWFEDKIMIEFVKLAENYYPVGAADLTVVIFADKRRLDKAWSLLPKTYIETGYVTFAKTKGEHYANART